MEFFRHLALVGKWLQEHPWTSVFASIYAWITAVHLDSFDSFMEASTPVLKWFSVVLALSIAIVTLLLKIRELFSGKKPKAQ